MVYPALLSNHFRLIIVYQNDIHTFDSIEKASQFVLDVQKTVDKTNLVFKKVIIVRSATYELAPAKRETRLEVDFEERQIHVCDWGHTHNQEEEEDGGASRIIYNWITHEHPPWKRQMEAKWSASNPMTVDHLKAILTRQQQIASRIEREFVNFC